MVRTEPASSRARFSNAAGPTSVTRLRHDVKAGLRALPGLQHLRATLRHATVPTASGRWRASTRAGGNGQVETKEQTKRQRSERWTKSVGCQTTTRQVASVKGVISGWLPMADRSRSSCRSSTRAETCRLLRRTSRGIAAAARVPNRASRGERELAMHQTRRCDACVRRGGGAHQQHGQKLLRGKACALRNSLCISAHLYTKHHNVLRASCAALRTLAQHVHYHGSFGSRHVLAPPVLRQEGGGVNMTPIPHQSLCPRNV